VFGIDIETCPACCVSVRIIACIEGPEMIEKILTNIDAKRAAAEASRLRTMPGNATGRLVGLKHRHGDQPPWLKH
jgi:hypothetical protein